VDGIKNVFFPDAGKYRTWAASRQIADCASFPRVYHRKAEARVLLSKDLERGLFNRQLV
jgi:hypothetical protein